MLEIKDLVKDYRSGDIVTHALKGINLSFSTNGFYSILGPSGCGKSTLLNLIGLLDRPTEGDIIIDGISTKNLKSNEQDEFRNKVIGFVFQSYHLIKNLNAYENIELPLVLGGETDKKVIEEKINALLKDVDLFELKDKRSSDLSGGQMQRIAIARALINNPKIILADEPTGALDSKTSLEVMDILKKLSENHLVILVTHNKELADKYSDKIIYLNDGEVTGQKDLHKVKERESEALQAISKKRNFISNRIIWALSLRNIFSKKLKTIISAVANCFGLVALGFILALTNGFTVYSDRVSYETASSLPINVPSYTLKTSSDDWKEINQAIEFPEDQAIFPYVSVSSEYTYTYNNYSEEYFDLLDSLVDEGLAVEYIKNYGNSYSYNLTTEFPQSIDGKSKSYVGSVTTTISAGGSYTSTGYGIPTNIFHVLYGDIDTSYDLLYGKLPENKNEIVLVVDSYNAINFSTLRAMGFYNSSDTSEEVLNPELESNVEPISFDDVVGKKYKIFSNDEIYQKTNNTQIFDEPILGSKRNLHTYKKNSVSDLYNDDSKGIELEISGIIRPKRENSITLLSPALCYLPELQDDLVAQKAASEISNDISENIVANFTDSMIQVNSFVQELKTYLNDYKNGDIEINATTFNDLIDKYFTYYYIEDSYHAHNSKGEITTWREATFETFLSDAKKVGAELIDEEIMSNFVDINPNNIDELIQDVIEQVSDSGDLANIYNYVINLGCYLNSYTTLQNIAIFPKGLEERNEILLRLDEFNDAQTDPNKKVYYVSLSSSLINSVSNMVSLVSLVLSIFVAVLLIVACAMNILFTYNNVLERTKDIGILRAVGTTKMDVSRMFIIEAGIVGLLSGLFSCLFTYVLAFPVNMLIAQHYAHYFSFQDICVVTWRHMFILVGIALILGIASAIAPAYSASKKDPVKCLKEE